MSKRIKTAISTDTSSFRAQLWVVEGNIGVGKTMVIESMGRQLLQLSRKPALHTEDVDRWISLGLLQPMYAPAADETLGSIATCAFETLGPFTDFAKRSLALFAANPAEVHIWERQISTTLEVFNKLSLDSEYTASSMTQSHSEALHYMVDVLDLLSGGKLKIKADVLIYLKMSAANCMERKNARDREGEESVSLDAMQRMSDAHDEYVAQYAPGQKKLVIDCNRLGPTGKLLTADAIAAEIINMVYPAAANLAGRGSETATFRKQPIFAEVCSL